MKMKDVTKYWLENYPDDQEGLKDLLRHDQEVEIVCFRNTGLQKHEMVSHVIPLRDGYIVGLA